MPATLSLLLSVAQLFLISLGSLFFLVDPIAAIPTFLVMTTTAQAEQRRHMAKRAAITCFVVLTAFGLAGTLIFKLFGITLPAFKIAGGIILLLIGIEMLQARRSPTKETPGETEEGAGKDDVGIIPLGIPMLAGPGSISTMMVLVGQSASWTHAVAVFAAVAVTSLLSYWILAGADRVRHYLGESGIRILMRIMGLLLTAIAVQFVLNGLADVGLIGVSPKHAG
jgi:multiple antibiotic resistance protein